MKKIFVVSFLFIAIAGGALWFVLGGADKQAQQAAKPVPLEQLDFRQLLTRSLACEENRDSEDCTRIFELLALKSQPQHAKQGENFWMRQMFRLGDWYAYAGTHGYEAGAAEAPEVAKAVELYDWVLEQKPFFSAQALLGKARLYDSQWNRDWAGAHRDEARALYENLVRRYPDSPYAAEATTALSRL